jgi:hypothetical protein
MDDIGEISLDSTSRSTRTESAAGSDKASEESNDRAARTNPHMPGKVMVTTTIKRESKPGTASFEQMAVEDGYYPKDHSRNLSGGPREQYMLAARTKITGGSNA